MLNYVKIFRSLIQGKWQSESSLKYREDFIVITGILRNETLLGKIKERLSEFCLVRCDFNRIQQYVDSKGCKLRLEEIFSDDEIKFILNLSEEEKKELLRILLKLLKQQGIEFGKVGLYKFGIEGKEEYAFVISK